ncbi:MAG: SemiSWEET family sugar transporter [Tenacibaculum sp.]
MKNIEILGLIAASLTTGAFVPQVYKAWKFKSTKDISLFMYTILLAGILLWIVYGVYCKSISILFANIITAMLVLFIIFLKLRYK